MKLIDRQRVEGTTPSIYIGHRTYLDKGSGKTKTSKQWYAEYCIDARSQYEALKTSNKSEAIRAAHQIISRLEAGQPKPPSRRCELMEVKDQYLGRLHKQNRAPKTLEKYEFVLDGLVECAEENNVRTATAYKESHFWDWYEKMKKDGLSEKTRYDRSIIAKQMFKWAASPAGRLIGFNPVADVTLDEPESTPQPCFTPDQVATLLDKADLRQRPIFAVMAYAGLRFGEVRDLQWMDLLLEQGKNGFIVVRRGGSDGKTKSGRIRRIPIHPELRKILDAVSPQFERVFTAKPSNKYPKGGGLLDERRLLMSLKRLCKRCGFTDHPKYKLHTFRHAFASMCARTNVSYKYALDWMGHKSSDILDLYYTMFDETAEAAIRTIDYAPKPKKETSAA